MQRILVLLQKLQALSVSGNKPTIIDTDLMLDYTRVLYADLLELRAGLARTPAEIKDEPTLEALAAAYEQKEDKIAHNQTLAPKAQSSPMRSMGSLIAVNDKYLLLSGIFGNNVTAYDIAITTLSDMPDLDAARKWMDGQNWPKDELAVQLLRDVVGQYFG